MFAIVLFFIGFVAVYYAYKSIKARHFARGILITLVAMFFLCGATTVTNQQGSSNSESSTAKSSSDSSDSSYSESQSRAKKNAKKGVEDINKKISETPELNGLKVKLDKYDNSGEDYDVEVPDTALGGTDAQQREIFKNIYKIISNETGNDNPTVYYYDNAGNEIAKTKWDGEIKLENE